MSEKYYHTELPKMNKMDIAVFLWACLVAVALIWEISQVNIVASIYVLVIAVMTYLMSELTKRAYDYEERYAKTRNACLSALAEVRELKDEKNRANQVEHKIKVTKIDGV